MTVNNNQSQMGTETAAYGARPATFRRMLDPVSRACEILFGLIMVLTFTLSLSATEARHADVRAMLIGMLGCNLAWAIIDAVMYLMGVRGEHQLAASTLRAVREAEDPATARTIIADYLPVAVLPALTGADFERIRSHLDSLSAEAFEYHLRWEDYLAALGVFLLVFLCLFPVAAPFFLFDDIALALRLSNAVAVAMLFVTGFAFGRQVGRPWRAGFVMVAIGTALVAIAIAFGG